MASQGGPPMLPTPSTAHLSFDNIYEPAEDTFLLMDTFTSPSQKAFLSIRFPQNTPTPLILEVGIGSGAVLAFVTANSKHIFDRADVAAIGTDMNPFAVRGAAQTVQEACREKQPWQGGLLVDTLAGDLATPFREGGVDVLIFNPPYVPTEELPPQDSARLQPDEMKNLSRCEKFERDSHLLTLSYAGGIDGMETTSRLLSGIPEILSERGVAYILLSAQNRPDQVCDLVRCWGDEWQAVRVSDSGKQAGWERLCVLRICRER